MGIDVNRLEALEASLEAVHGQYTSAHRRLRAASDRIGELRAARELGVVLWANPARVYPARVREIAAVLGVSEEQVRLDTIAAAAKLGIRMVNGQPRPGDGARIEELMNARPASKPKIRRTWRGKVGTPPPAPVAIVREERDAPPVRERSADEIFTF